jgi:hypothetical protein
VSYCVGQLFYLPAPYPYVNLIVEVRNLCTDSFPQPHNFPLSNIQHNRFSMTLTGVGAGCVQRAFAPAAYVTQAALLHGVMRDAMQREQTCATFCTCHLLLPLSSLIASQLALAMEMIFERLDTMDAECLDRYCEWFAHFLSNFDYKWTWSSWYGARARQTEREREGETVNPCRDTHKDLIGLTSSVGSRPSPPSPTLSAQCSSARPSCASSACPITTVSRHLLSPLSSLLSPLSSHTHQGSIPPELHCMLPPPPAASFRFVTPEVPGAAVAAGVAERVRARAAPEEIVAFLREVRDGGG